MANNGETRRDVLRLLGQYKVLYDQILTVSSEDTHALYKKLERIEHECLDLGYLIRHDTHDGRRFYAKPEETGLEDPTEARIYAPLTEREMVLRKLGML